MPKDSDHKIYSAEAHSYCSTGAAYADGDLIGAKMTFSNILRSDIGGAMVVSAEVLDASTNAAALDLLLFNADVSTASVYSSGDNAALAVAAADLANLVGVVSFSTGDYSQFADNEIAVVNNIGLGVYMPNGQDLYGVMVSRGTPTYTSTDDLTVRINIER